MVHGSEAGMPRGVPAPLDRGLAVVERFAEHLAGAFLLLAGLLITTSVLCRTFLGFSIPDDVTLVGLMVVAITTLPFARVQATSGHMAVTVVTDVLPPWVSVVGRLIGDLLGLVVYGLMSVLVAMQVPEAFAQGYYYDGPLHVPVWPMKALFAAALGLFALRLVLCIVNELVTLAVRQGGK